MRLLVTLCLMNTPALPTFKTSLLALSLALTLAACASSSGAPNGASAPQGNVLGLGKVDVPAALQAAKLQPYAVPGDGQCAALLTEVRALDEVLGPDLDTPASAEHPGLIERGATEGGNVIADAVKGSTEGLIPYRGWIRKLSGAEQSSRNLSAAIAAGGIRRGFLKGLRLAKSC